MDQSVSIRTPRMTLSRAAPRNPGHSIEGDAGLGHWSGARVGGVGRPGQRRSRTDVFCGRLGRRDSRRLPVGALLSPGPPSGQEAWVRRWPEAVPQVSASTASGGPIRSRCWSYPQCARASTLRNRRRWSQPSTRAARLEKGCASPPPRCRGRSQVPGCQEGAPASPWRRLISMGERVPTLRPGPRSSAQTRPSARSVALGSRAATTA